VKKTPDDGQRYCPKHVEFYSKNKFEKLVHFVGFIVRIRHRLFIKLFKANVSTECVILQCREEMNVTMIIGQVHIGGDGSGILQNIPEIILKVLI